MPVNALRIFSSRGFIFSSSSITVMTIDNSFMCVKGNISISDSNSQWHLGVVSASAFLCFSGIYICHRDSETQKSGLRSARRKFKLAHCRHLQKKRPAKANLLNKVNSIKICPPVQDSSFSVSIFQYPQ